MTTSSRIEAAAHGRRLTGRHVLMIFLGFFGVVFAVNGVFVREALHTYSGIVSNDPYVKGLHYNDRIAASERQAALGWSEQVTVGLDGSVAIAMKTAAGEPVRGLHLAGSIGRPATSQFDRPLQLAEAEPGRYVARAGALDQGDWVIALNATEPGKADEPVYRLRRRLWLKP